jgi:Cu(I)/Ag(I) efflux system periplasmic protein CusF
MNITTFCKVAAGLVLGLSAAATWAQATDGEVRKVDKAAGKVTLKHGEIKNLEMPPMTMVFRVKDPAFLDQVAAGDKVRFDAEKIDGQYVVTAIRKAP